MPLYGQYKLSEVTKANPILKRVDSESKVSADDIVQWESTYLLGIRHWIWFTHNTKPD